MLEGSWVGDKTREAFYLRLDISICGGMELNVKRVKEYFLINVPVLKGHCQTKITCALKNMKG